MSNPAQKRNYTAFEQGFPEFNSQIGLESGTKRVKVRIFTFYSKIHILDGSNWLYWWDHQYEFGRKAGIETLARN